VLLLVRTLVLLASLPLLPFLATPRPLASRRSRRSTDRDPRSLLPPLALLSLLLPLAPTSLCTPLNQYSPLHPSSKAHHNTLNTLNTHQVVLNTHQVVLNTLVLHRLNPAPAPTQSFLLV